MSPGIVIGNPDQGLLEITEHIVRKASGRILSTNEVLVLRVLQLGWAYEPEIVVRSNGIHNVIFVVLVHKQ